MAKQRKHITARRIPPMGSKYNYEGVPKMEDKHKFIKKHRSFYLKTKTNKTAKLKSQ